MANQRKKTKVAISVYIERTEREKWYDLAKAYGSPNLGEFIRTVINQKKIEAPQLCPHCGRDDSKDPMPCQCWNDK
jgi:hypothetical protein